MAIFKAIIEDNMESLIQELPKQSLNKLKQNDKSPFAVAIELKREKMVEAIALHMKKMGNKIDRKEVQEYGDRALSMSLFITLYFEHGEARTARTSTSFLEALLDIGINVNPFSSHKVFTNQD